MEQQEPNGTRYRVEQLGAPQGPGHSQRNEAVSGFASLVAHHPLSNRHAYMVDGRITSGEKGRMHAFVSGTIEEIELARNGRTFGLKPDQVLLKKDFILENPAHPRGSPEARRVDVPSPVAGYVAFRSDREGRVDIYDKAGGHLVARVRHMSQIPVREGDTVAYGERLGIQDKVLTGARHVHMEMDMRYYPQFRNYISDLTSGRLAVEAEHRRNVAPLGIIDDGALRLGESSPRIRDLQRVMHDEGYRAAGGGPLDRDGVYRLGMQGALLDFQREHGVPQTGDVDPATLGFAPRARPREADRPDHFRPGHPLPATREPGHAPGHPGHHDHRPDLPDVPEPAVNQRSAHAPHPGSPTHDPLLARLAAALRDDDEGALSRACAEIERSSSTQAAIRAGHAQLAADDVRQHQSRDAVRQREAPAIIGA